MVPLLNEAEVRSRETLFQLLRGRNRWLADNISAIASAQMSPGRKVSPSSLAPELPSQAITLLTQRYPPGLPFPDT
jgi:hypothetical protein